jgi:hypothetical protein
MEKNVVSWNRALKQMNCAICHSCGNVLSLDDIHDGPEGQECDDCCKERQDDTFNIDNPNPLMVCG